MLFGTGSTDTAARLLSLHEAALSKSLERLASGLRINHASDDAAGLALSAAFTSDINGSNAALNNVQDASGLLNVADGALSTNTDTLQQIRDLTVEASNGTYNQSQRDAIGQQIQQLANSLDATAQSTQFNGTPLLDGSASINVQAGPNAGDTINASIPNAGTDGASGGINLFNSGGGTTFTDSANLAANFTQANAQSFLSDIDNAIANTNSIRSTIGSAQNQLDSAASNLSVSIENTSAARASILDTNVASESANYVQNQILSQSSALILAQSLKMNTSLYSTLLKL